MNGLATIRLFLLLGRQGKKECLFKGSSNGQRQQPGSIPKSMCFHVFSHYYDEISHNKQFNGGRVYCALLLK